MDSQNTLKRTLTLRDLVIYGLSMSSPLSLYLVYGSVAQASFGMVALVYAIGTLLMLFTIFSYVQYSKEVPISGSIYSYISKGINPHVGFVGGWLILGYYIAVPGLVFGLSASWLGTLLPNVPSLVWVAILVVFNTFINIRGLEIGKRINLILMTLQVLSILVFIGLGIKFVFVNHLGVGGFSLDPIFQAENVNLSFLATSVSIAVIGFLGLDGISALAEEADNPKRNVGLSMLIALLLVGFSYVVQGYLSGLIHPNYSDLDPDLGMFEIAKEIGGQGFYVWMVIINVLAFGVACTGGIQSALSRVLYTMGRDKILPSFLAKLHPTYKTPINASLTTGVVSLIVGGFVSPTIILLFVNFGAITAYTVLNLSVVIYFYIKQKRRSPKETLLYLIMPLTGFAVCLFAWSGFDKITFIAGFAWTLFGVIVGAVSSKGYKITPKIEDL